MTDYRLISQMTDVELYGNIAAMKNELARRQEEAEKAKKDRLAGLKKAVTKAVRDAKVPKAVLNRYSRSGPLSSTQAGYEITVNIYSDEVSVEIWGDSSYGRQKNDKRDEYALIVSDALKPFNATWWGDHTFRVALKDNPQFDPRNVEEVEDAE